MKKFTLYDFRRLAPTLRKIEMEKRDQRTTFAFFIILFLLGTLLYAVIMQGYFVTPFEAMIQTACCGATASVSTLKRVDQVIFLIFTNGAIFLTTHWFMQNESKRKMQLLEDFIADPQKVSPEEKAKLMSIFYEDLKQSIVLEEKYQNLSIK